MNKETILVTGGAGFIGSHLVSRLLRSGYGVRVIDRKESMPHFNGSDASPLQDQIQYISADIRDKNALDEALDGIRTVYHLAATVSVPLCEKDPSESYSNNVMATIGLLEALKKIENRRIIFASSAALYGHKGKQHLPLRESDTAETFLSFYAAQKHACEQAIQLYTSSTSIRSFIFRFFNVFGPGQDPLSPYSGVISIFVELIRNHRDLPLNGGGHQTRDFVSIHDLTQAMIQPLALDDSQWDGQPINLGSGCAITIRHLAETLIRLSGSRSKIVIAPPRNGDVIHSLASIQLAQERLSFQPQVSLETGLNELINLNY